MLIDLEQDGNTLPCLQKTSVCIAGAGVAGLVLATALADAGIDVHLLEAGGRTLEDRSQSLYDAEMAGIKHVGTTEGRFRMFGGSSTRWGGQLLPFSSEVFSPLPTLPSFAWPITPGELEPFYRQIETILGANHLPFCTNLYKSLGLPVPADFDSNPDIYLRFSKWAPFSHRNLARTLGKRAVKSGRITVFLHANLVESLLSPDGSRIEAFLVRNYDGKQFRFEADQYVMAAGTIETSRLLLASRSVCTNGVGNSHDQVGRCLHDHLSAPVAHLNGDARQKLLSWFGPFLMGSTTHVGRIEASPGLRERLDLLAVQAHFTIEEPEDSGLFVVRNLLRSIQRGSFRATVFDSLPRLPRAARDITRLTWAAKVRKRRMVSERASMLLQILCEQRARQENRVRLADGTRDALGMLKAVVDWRIGSEEFRSIRCFAEWLQKEFTRLGVNVTAWHSNMKPDGTGHLAGIRDTNHPMGGTIMGTDPALTVVDTQLKIHGLANMFLASCSTFPSGGSSNPTFTLIALTLRLAEHLKVILPSDRWSSKRSIAPVNAHAAAQ